MEVGVLSHLSEGTKYDTTHADYMALSDTDKAALDDPADLTGFGFYVGGGAEFPIPGLSSTKIGGSGFFFSGALSKMAGIPSLDVYKRLPGCSAGENCTQQPEGAGRPLFKAGKAPNDPTLVGTHGEGDDAVMFAKAQALKVDDFDPDDLQTVTLFKEDYSVGSPDSPVAGEGHINEIKLNSGFSANGGVTHSFGSQIALHVNGGFYSASEGDYSATGFMAGSSLDYKPVAGTTFTVGGEFASASVSHGGEETDPVKKEFDADAQAFDPSFSVTLSVTQSF